MAQRVEFSLFFQPVTQSYWTAWSRSDNWPKGWLQTWLVMMRDPARTIDEMGFAAFATFQLPGVLTLPAARTI